MECSRHSAKLLGPVKWRYYYLYVMLDMFSRYVVGWLLADHEAASLAQELIATTCERQNTSPRSTLRVQSLFSCANTSQDMARKRRERPTGTPPLVA